MAVQDEIHTAMREKKILRISYVKKTTGETKDYLVEPYELKMGKDGRALYAYDLDAESIKMYYISNLRFAETQEQTFEPRWPIKM